ncbi:hypothetical protein D0C36_13405 [Mucilaginibacter conchicola]|uniref:Uncharacterized protein n=1 Tax=Mucilaginibacter conchicola TaxID=2303333 RepID=A0A372NUR8_9SPHI|nr:hypothetical protein [Mucilaginibacter conchicola]RFZ92419.1 hypothetical protein D0C36_13405 [Mucilaginibacter conchicola]
MTAIKNKTDRLNLASCVIALHGLGYTEDFLPLNGNTFVCLQNNQNFAIDDLYIRVIDRGFDTITRSYKYIHTIDTPNGEKGLLIADAACSPTSLAN